MTIKQNGGIFGRNPSFKSIELDGADLETTLDAKADLAGDTFTGTVNVSTSGNAEINATRASGSSARMQAQSARAVIGTTTNHELRFMANNAQYVNLSTAGNLSVMSGNLVIGTSGKGIDFSATSGTGTSELFDDYEEGTWTPVVADASSGGNTSASVFSGDYTKVGNLVFVNCSLVDIDTTGLTSGNDLYIQGLPFTPKSGTLFAGSVFGRVTISGKWCTAAISTSAAIRLEDNPGTTSNPSRVPVSGIVDDGGDLRISITYIEA